VTAAATGAGDITDDTEVAMRRCIAPHRKGQVFQLCAGHGMGQITDFALAGSRSRMIEVRSCTTVTLTLGGSRAVSAPARALAASSTRRASASSGLWISRMIAGLPFSRA
jgi:hypothetical protein